MPIAIRDEHLEKKIDRERRRRGDATQAKTLCNLALERITQLEVEGAYDSADPIAANTPAVADAAAKC